VTNILGASLAPVRALEILIVSNVPPPCRLCSTGLWAKAMQPRGAPAAATGGTKQTVSERFVMFRYAFQDSIHQGMNEPNSNSPVVELVGTGVYRAR